MRGVEDSVCVTLSKMPNSRKMEPEELNCHPSSCEVMGTPNHLQKIQINFPATPPSQKKKKKKKKKSKDKNGAETEGMANE